MRSQLQNEANGINCWKFDDIEIEFIINILNVFGIFKFFNVQHFTKETESELFLYK